MGRVLEIPEKPFFDDLDRFIIIEALHVRNWRD
jgi:hypothetical protein